MQPNDETLRQRSCAWKAAASRPPHSYSCGMPASALDAATDLLDRADAMLSLDTSGIGDGVRSDLRRMAWAVAVAAIDTYMHWVVRKADLSGPLPKQLSEIKVDFGDLVASANESLDARREGRNDRPNVRARNVLNERLLFITFQSPKAIEDGLRMLGVQDPWGRLSRAITPHETPAAIREHLTSLSRRRNRIVHEGDLSRGVRPRSVRKDPMTRPEIDTELAWVRGFVVALSTVAP